MQRATRLNGGGSASTSLNRFMYAGANPVTARDPSGRAVAYDSALDGGACTDPACVGNSGIGIVPCSQTTTTLAAEYGIDLTASIAAQPAPVPAPLACPVALVSV